MAVTLTARKVETIRPDPSKRLEIPDATMPGLYLVVQSSGSKSWALRYRFEGKTRKLTLGSEALMSLVEAREAARVALRAVEKGTDPGKVKSGEKAAKAEGRFQFGTVVAEFVDRYAKRNRTWKQTEAILIKGDLSRWQERDIRQISRRDVLDVLDGIVERGAGTQANRLFAALRRFFGWAVERGVLDASPCTNLKSPSPEVSRDRVLTDDELVAVWRGAEGTPYPFGPLVHLLILTGQRRSEVAEAEWREFDVDAKTWTIPKERSKNGEAHVVPLSPAASILVASLPRIGIKPRYLFTTTAKSPFSGFSKAMRALSSAVSEMLGDGVEMEPWRIHDLRRTFASGWARLGIPVHVTEKALNHISGSHSGIVGVYQRHAYLGERRHAMNAWATYVEGLLTEPAKNVVPLRGTGK